MWQEHEQASHSRHTLYGHQTVLVCIWSTTKSRYSRVEKSGTLNTETENAGQKKMRDHIRDNLSLHGRHFLDTREHRPSRSAGAIVNNVIIIFYLQDRCPKWPFTGRVHGP